jgi:hypothetical protein
MGGYIMAPNPINYITFAAVTIGTALAAASANTFNQYIEAHSLLCFSLSPFKKIAKMRMRMKVRVREYE